MPYNLLDFSCLVLWECQNNQINLLFIQLFQKWLSSIYVDCHMHPRRYFREKKHKNIPLPTTVLSIHSKNSFFP